MYCNRNIYSCNAHTITFNESNNYISKDYELVLFAVRSLFGLHDYALHGVNNIIKIEEIQFWNSYSFEQCRGDRVITYNDRDDSRFCFL